MDPKAVVFVLLLEVLIFSYAQETSEDGFKGHVSYLAGKDFHHQENFFDKTEDEKNNLKNSGNNEVKLQVPLTVNGYDEYHDKDIAHSLVDESEKLYPSGISRNLRRSKRQPAIIQSLGNIIHSTYAPGVQIHNGIIHDDDIIRAVARANGIDYGYLSSNARVIEKNPKNGSATLVGHTRYTGSVFIRF